MIRCDGCGNALEVHPPGVAASEATEVATLTLPVEWELEASGRDRSWALSRATDVLSTRHFCSPVCIAEYAENEGIRQMLMEKTRKADNES